MIFIDTGAFLARYIKRDQHHDAATEQWSRLRIDRRRLFTSSFVLDELMTLLARRANAHFAAERAKNLFRSQSLTILRPDWSDERSALQLFEQYADQSLSFTDCISFALMDRHDIRIAFTFDHHFRIGGFTTEP